MDLGTVSVVVIAVLSIGACAVGWVYGRRART
jgi:hypothetical protein